MKLDFFRALAAAAALCMLGSSPAVAVDASDDLSLTPIQLSPNVYYFGGEASMASAANKGFMSNAGFVVTNDGVVAFDALGTAPLGAAMLDAIATVTDQPVKRVIVSHYHADHVYGLQEFKSIGADIWAHANGQSYLTSEDAQERLEQRRTDLAPWVDENTHVVGADRWLDFAQDNVVPFTMGGMSFQVIDVSGAHSDEDIMLYVEDDNILFAGDLYFTGRIPYVANADSKAWLKALDSMLDVNPEIVVPGHGRASSDTAQDMLLTRNYLEYLRQEMGAAVDEMIGFEEVYQSTDWSMFKDYPAFEDANRINAYGQYLLMERESLEVQ